LLRAEGASSLSEAQLKIARSYGFASWPKLKAHIESIGKAEELADLKRAIDTNDLDRVKQLMTRNPALHRLSRAKVALPPPLRTQKTGR